MRRQRNAYRRSGSSGSLLLIAILILTAVAAGYAGTKYLIAPYILEGKLWSAPQSVQNSDPNPDSVQNPVQTQLPDSTATAPGIVSGQQNVKDTKELTSNSAVSASGAAVKDTAVQPAAASAPSGKFAVQFGSFSTQGSAEKAVSELAEIQVAASVLQRGTTYKVVGTAFATKAEAQAEAERLRTVVADVYVTGI